MKIGILETGAPPRSLRPAFGRYDSMMADLIGPGFETAVFRADRGELPESPDLCAGYLITGSAADAYDDLPWIADLKSFLRGAKGRTKLVGICFGHQVMAEAFGGRVVKSGKGWGLGLQRYDVQGRPAWMDDAATLSIPATHQDQVVGMPPAATVLAGNAFAPLAALAYTDQPAISFQGHPEFSVGFAKALLETVHGPRLGRAELDRIAASLDAPNDCARVGATIGRFLRGEDWRGARP